MSRLSLFLLASSLSAASAFVAPSSSRLTFTRSRTTGLTAPSSSRLSMHPELPSLVTAYSDDPLGDLLFGANGVVVAGILAAVVAVGASFVTLLPKVGSASFELTDEEQAACLRVENAYDAAAWEKELTEEGTKGYVNRRRKANEAKDRYQSSSGLSRREMKDRSLRYSEADLGFVACLLRAAEPSPGDVLYDLGSGAGRSTLACAAVFPQFSKVIGIEFLAGLTKLANGYKGKVRGRKAAVEFRTGDVAAADLSGAGCVFVGPASYMSDVDLGAALNTLPSGATVMTIDKRLGGGFGLVTEVEDPSGDLVLNTGYVYRKQ